MPLRIAVRGPPSSGKTALCEALAARFHLHLLSGDAIVNESLLKASIALNAGEDGDDGDEILSAAKTILKDLEAGLEEAAQIDVEEDGGDAKARAEREKRQSALEGVMELRQSTAVAERLASKVRFFALFSLSLWSDCERSLCLCLSISVYLFHLTLYLSVPSDFVYIIPHPPTHNTTRIPYHRQKRSQIYHMAHAEALS